MTASTEPAEPFGGFEVHVYVPKHADTAEARIHAHSVFPGATVRVFTLGDRAFTKVD